MLSSVTEGHQNNINTISGGKVLKSASRTMGINEAFRAFLLDMKAEIASKVPKNNSDAYQ